MTQPLGYIVVMPHDDHDKSLTADWDGEIHNTLQAGHNALNDCHTAGYTNATLAALHPTEPPPHIPATGSTPMSGTT